MVFKAKDQTTATVIISRALISSSQLLLASMGGDIWMKWFDSISTPFTLVLSGLAAVCLALTYYSTSYFKTHPNKIRRDYPNTGSELVVIPEQLQQREMWQVHTNDLYIAGPIHSEQLNNRQMKVN